MSFIEGIGEQAVNLVTDIVGADGILDLKTDSLNSELERIQEEWESLDERIEAYRERLVSQFSAADTLISQLNSTGDYLTQQLAALTSQSSSN